jgi:hypothetical protein
MSNAAFHMKQLSVSHEQFSLSHECFGTKTVM